MTPIASLLNLINYNLIFYLLDHIFNPGIFNILINLINMNSR